MNTVSILTYIHTYIHIYIYTFNFIPIDVHSLFYFIALHFTMRYTALVSIYIYFQCTVNCTTYPIIPTILSYHIISYHILSYPILSYHILSYPIISYHILSYPTLYISWVKKSERTVDITLDKEIERY
jgi:hypothetical protein